MMQKIYDLQKEGIELFQIYKLKEILEEGVDKYIPLDDLINISHNLKNNPYYLLLINGVEFCDKKKLIDNIDEIYKKSCDALNAAFINKNHEYKSPDKFIEFTSKKELVNIIESFVDIKLRHQIDGELYNKILWNTYFMSINESENGNKNENKSNNSIERNVEH